MNPVYRDHTNERPRQNVLTSLNIPRIGVVQVPLEQSAIVGKTIYCKVEESLRIYEVNELSCVRVSWYSQYLLTFLPRTFHKQFSNLANE